MAPKEDILPAADQNDMAKLAACFLGENQYVLDRSRSVLLLRSNFDAYEGVVRTGALIRIAVAIDRPVTVYQDSGGAKLETWWRPGQILVTPSARQVESRTSALRMIGIAIDLDQCAHMNNVTRQSLKSIDGEHLYDDPLIVSVLQTLWLEAHFHGSSTAFFEHGVALVASRLSTITPVPAAGKGLSQEEFSNVAELIESRLSDDISVSEMAAVVGRDPSGFSRAFRQTSGTTPFHYLTRRRMERACIFLKQGRMVSDVAIEVGYLNASKFAAAFLRYFGQSPSDFRNALRHSRQ